MIDGTLIVSACTYYWPHPLTLSLALSTPIRSQHLFLSPPLTDVDRDCRLSLLPRPHTQYRLHQMDTIVRNLPAESFISIEGNKRHYWKWNDERNEEKSLVRKPEEEEEEGLEPEEDLKEDEEEDLWAELDDSPQSQRPSLQSQERGCAFPGARIEPSVARESGPLGG